MVALAASVGTSSAGTSSAETSSVSGALGSSKACAGASASVSGNTPPLMMVSIWVIIGSIATSPSALVDSRLSIICRKASVEARITSIILDVTTISPLRRASRIFSERCASWLIRFSPRNPEAPLSECIGRKISLSRARLSGVFSSSRRLGSIVSKCSRASKIKSVNSSGSNISWLILVLPH